MSFYKSAERNVQMLVFLLKEHGIRKVIASPGTTNINFVASVQFDDYFEVYSAVDERSAAYMACGMAAETGEPVVITCTGATASRNYVPGLTEAFYRKLPVLAVTATQHIGRIGQNIPQVIDRRNQMNDLVKYSLHLPMIRDEEDEWAYGVKINEALLELRHRGGGPVHINLETKYGRDFSVKEIKPVKVIRRDVKPETFPELNAKRVAVYVGAHAAWTDELTKAVDDFCETYNAAVYVDHSSNYAGKYRFFFSLLTDQRACDVPELDVDLMIDIGNVSGAYGYPHAKEVWRVNPDGMIRDTARLLTKVFEADELTFFTTYNEKKKSVNAVPVYHAECMKARQRFEEKIGNLPFSNIWIAQQTAGRLPENSVLHLGILNSLRSWNFFPTPKSVANFVNTGGFGIDGCMSSLIGASLGAPQKLFFGVFGDLAFFYDLNSMGNHHLGCNVRIMLINNGRGTEFRNYSHLASDFGDDADAFMSAAGHFGNQSPELIRHYAQDLGFEYMSASNKEEYRQHMERFLTSELTDKPMLFEVFTNSAEESQALYIINHLVKSKKVKTKQMIKKMIGQKGIRIVKQVLRKG